jgi:hypothetical protein
MAFECGKASRYVSRSENKDSNKCCAPTSVVAFIHSTRKAETIQMFTNKSMDKQNVTYAYNRLLLSYGKGWSSDT